MVFSTPTSSHWLPMICRPIGRPSPVLPTHTVPAGLRVMLIPYVKATQPSVSLPLIVPEAEPALGVWPHVVGVRMKSPAWNASTSLAFR